MAIPVITGPTFIVEDLSIASGGLVTPDVAYEIGEATPPQASAQTALERLYGVDLRFGEDLVVKASGDLQLTRGLEAFKANFARALVTPRGGKPGGIFWRPEYGVGITEFLNRRAGQAEREEMKNRIRSSAASDPNVEAITRLEVRTADEPVGLVEVFVHVTVGGQSGEIHLAIRGT